MGSSQCPENAYLYIYIYKYIDMHCFTRSTLSCAACNQRVTASSQERIALTITCVKIPLSEAINQDLIQERTLISFLNVISLQSIICSLISSSFQTLQVMRAHSTDSLCVTMLFF